MHGFSYFDRLLDALENILETAPSIVSSDGNDRFRRGHWKSDVASEYVSWTMSGL